jgi:iron complex outermembrane receptor protein
MDLHHRLTGAAGAAQLNTSSPQHQFQMHSTLNLPRNWEWDTHVYTVGSLPGQQVGGYVRADTRLGWHFGEGMDISVIGQNLLRDRHSEFNTLGGSSVDTTQVRRSSYAKLTWAF